MESWVLENRAKKSDCDSVNKVGLFSTFDLKFSEKYAFVSFSHSHLAGFDFENSQRVQVLIKSYKNSWYRIEEYKTSVCEISKCDFANQSSVFKILLSTF